jgi:hypothetical protein
MELCKTVAYAELRARIACTRRGKVVLKKALNDDDTNGAWMTLNGRTAISASGLLRRTIRLRSCLAGKGVGGSNPPSSTHRF